MNLFRSRPGVRPAKRFIPQCETLENRWCPSAFVKVAQHTLIVHGDNQADTISIVDDGKGDVSATITPASGKAVSGSGTGITNIEVFSGNGNDSISYSLSSVLGQNQSLHLQTGKGSDTFTLDATAGISNGSLSVHLNGGKGADQMTANFGALTNAKVALFTGLGKSTDQATLNFAAISQSDVLAVLNGGSGKDSVTADFAGDITDSNVGLRANLGAGNDTFTDTLGGNILGSSNVGVRVNGGPGSDSVTINAPATNIAANSRLGVDVNGGPGADSVSVNWEGQLNGALAVHEDGGPGSDTSVENLTADSGSTGTLKARLHAGPGKDSDTLNVIDNSGGGGTSTLADLDAVIHTGPGHDTVVNTSNVKVEKSL
jgi:hypothetical protein